MDDTFRLDLADHDKEYIQNVLDTFFEMAADHGRKLIEIRMSKPMADRLGIEGRRAGGSFRGIPVAVGDTGFEETIEVILGPIH
jgi:hypothetical protein